MQVRTSAMASGPTRTRARWLVPMGLLLALVVGAPVLAAENGLRVLAVPPASGGTTRVQVEVVDPALEASLRKGPVEFFTPDQEAEARAWLGSV